MNEYKCVPLDENVEEMFIGPFGSSLKNECFVDEDEAYCMVYEQKHAIQKTMDVETRYVNEQKYNELKRFNIHGGDIIVSCRGTIGETFVVPEDAPLGIMHPSIMKIRLKDGVYDKYYFNLLLKSRLKKHEAEANGSGIKMAISATELGRELFPVPTMQEQQEITDIISGISAVIEKRKQELSALDDLIKARFVEMFGDPVSNPLGWEKKMLKTVCVKLNDGTHFSPESFEEGEYKYVTAKNIKESGFDFTNITYVSEAVHRPIYERCNPELGDVLYIKDGVTTGIAMVNTLNEEFTLLSSVALLKQNRKIMDGYFLAAVLNNENMYSDIRSNMGGAAITRLTIAKLNMIQIIVPPLKLQQQFADFVHQVDKSKVAVQKALDETQLLFDSLMQQYFG